LYSTNGTGVIRGKVYISGGLLADRNYRTELFVYDPATNSWTQKSHMPSQGFRGVSGVINNQLYVVTNCEDSSDGHCDFIPRAFYRYDPTTDEWTVLPDVPNYHGWGVGGVIGGKFYVAGGSNQVDVYDPATNQWTTKTPMATRRWLGAGATVAGKLYLVAGFRLRPDGTTANATATSVYDLATDKWTNKAPFPGNQKAHIAGSRVLSNGQVRIHVLGGTKPGNNLAYIP
jgi:N-acetylneuraminic acid mutarotase